MRIHPLIVGSALALALLNCPSSLPAAPIVDFATTGSIGDWTLDFTVQNTLNAPMDIYSFSLYNFPEELNLTVVNVPAGFQIIGHGHQWYDGSYSFLPAGTSLSGFTVHVTSDAAPASMQWAAFAVGLGGQGGTYTGTDYVGEARNPEFFGVAGTPPEVVPDSTSMLGLLGLTMVGLAALARKLVHHTNTA
jgi:hypothetical protein